MSGGCPQAAALERIAGVLEALNAPAVDGGESVIARFARAADALADLGEAQKKLCTFIVKHRVKIVLSVIGALMAVGAISPTAAEGLKEVLRTWGPL